MENVQKRFIVFNETKKVYSSMPKLAKILNKAQKSLYNECNSAFRERLISRYIDEVSGDTYRVEVLG